MKIFKRRSLVGGVIAALVVAGAAYAYWSAGGSGSGSASAAGAQTPLVAHQASTLSAMYPGDSPQTISGNFDNSNSGPIHVASVTASISGVTKAGDAPAGTCDASDFTLSNAQMSVGHEVAKGTGVDGFSGATIQFKDQTTTQDACQGATVHVSFAIA